MSLHPENRTTADWVPRLVLGHGGNEFHFSVSPPALGSVVQIQLDLSKGEEGSATLKCDEALWRAQWNDCKSRNPIPDLLSDLVDACIAAKLGENDCAMVLVKGIDEKQVYLTSVVRSNSAGGSIYIRTLDIPSTITTDFTIPNSGDRNSIVRSYQELVTWIADDSFTFDGKNLKNTLLLVKVDPSQLWFLKYPLALFVRFGLGIFLPFKSVQWIVTSRTLTANTINRKALAKELRSTAALLRGTVVVVNEYSGHLQSAVGPLVRETIATLQELLTQFEDVHFEDTRYSLRWALNPTSDLLDKLLINPSTHLFFSAFEAGSGKWQLSDKTIDSHQSQINAEEFYDLAKFRGCLGHIQLLRIFHCNSIFDPYVAASEGSNPADANTIARQLLETDAQFVEGGMTEESYFDFACSVISLFFGTGLRMILESRAAEGKLCLNSLIDKCNKIFRGQGLELISS